MFLTITSRSTDPARPASDLGYLLHKHPERAQTYPVSMGQAHVFFPAASATECTAALMVEIDPIALVRNKRLGGADAFSLAQYVNDRPYAASSMLAVALGKVFATARAGRCEARPELARTPLDLTIRVPALPARGGPQWVARCFEPLGWHVETRAVPLDPDITEWGESRYVELCLTGRQLLADALQHLYVLLPVLDDAKHYWVGPDEVDKLVRAGSGWLADHPERDQIAYRYLAHRRALARGAVDRLLEVGEDLAGEVAELELDEPATFAPTTASANQAQPSSNLATTDTSAQPRLADERADAIVAALLEAGATSVVDLGCGEGRLLARLLDIPRLTRVLGVDVSARALQRAADRLDFERLPERQRERVELAQTSLTYRDPRIAGFDAAVLQEVIEHIDPPRLEALARNVFGHARPGTVIVTTPNAEFNVHFRSLTQPNHAGSESTGLRHPDHRFEWNRAEFARWAASIEAYGYTSRITGVGPQDDRTGCPTQLAVFTAQPSTSARADHRAPTGEPPSDGSHR